MKRKRTRRLLGVLFAVLLFAGSLLLPSAAAGTVTVNDANLRSALKSALGTGSITTDNMKSLTTLDLSGKKISDLTGLEAAVNLTHLSLRNNSVADLSALAGLTQLATLDLSGNRISSVTPLASMSSLRVLHLTDNEVDSLVALETLQKLQFLFCENNRLKLSEGSPASGSIKNLLYRGCYVVTGTQKSEPDPGSGSSSSSSLPPASSSSVITDARITVKPGSSAKIDRTTNYLSGIAPNTPVTKVQALLDGSGCTLRVLNSSGAAASGNFSTGMKVQLINSVGTVLDTLTVVIYGDVNGDGTVNVLDLAILRKQIVGAIQLDPVKFSAANLNAVYKKDLSDTVINVIDLALMRKIIVGSLTIS